MRRLAWLLLGFSAVVFVTALGGSLVLRGKLSHDRAVRRASLARQLAEHHEAFLADQRLAVELELFAPHNGTDAGPYLNPRLVWDGSPELNAAFAATHPDVRPLTLPQALTDRLGAEWATAPNLDLSEVDLSWFAELPKYGYWDLEANSPLALMPRFDPLTAPLPNFIALLRWSKLRLRHGLETHTLPAALAETRALARLAYTTETLLGAMVAAAVLGYEEELRAAATYRGLAPLPAWLAPEAAPRLRRMLYAAGAYVQRDLPEHYTEVFSHLSVGQCAALQESLLPELFVLRPLLAKQQPQAYARLDRWLAASTPHCRLTQLRRAWADDRQIRTELASRSYWCAMTNLDREATDDCLLGWLVGWLPGTRQLLGELLTSVARVDYFRYYEAPVSR